MNDRSAVLSEILAKLARSVEQRDATIIADIFHEDAEYHDLFYGAFRGHEDIFHMITDRFHRDGEDFKWIFRDPIGTKEIGYAWYDFSYASKLDGLEGCRTVLTGAALVRLHEGRILSYREFGNSGATLAKLGASDDLILKHVRRSADELALV